MIYSRLNDDEPLSQGDIVNDCPVHIWNRLDAEVEYSSVVMRPRVIVLTQACDLAQTKTDRVIVAIVHDAHALVDAGILKAQTIRDHIRTHRVYGWYFLPAGENTAESVVDLRNLHTIPSEMLDQLVTKGKRICRLITPYREHMEQHFSTTYSRIGLPLPYETDEAEQS